MSVQIDVQAVNEELPVSRVNTHSLAEVLREWDQGEIESLLGDTKFYFTPLEKANKVDVKRGNVLVQSIVVIKEEEEI